MAVNWPPAAGTFPDWPPPEIQSSQLSCSDWKNLLAVLRDLNFSHAAPTQAEQSAFFQGVKCGDNHNVIGRMLVSPDGTRRYPFAVCNNSADRELLVLWPPYTCGSQSGPTSF